MRENLIYTSLVARPVRAIRVTRGGLEPSVIARGRPRLIFLTSLTGDVTSEIAEDSWERGWNCIPLIVTSIVFMRFPINVKRNKNTY